jgi:hypothetical protein
MSEEPTSSSSAKPDTHWLGWTLGLVAVPLVYLLALPPIAFATMKNSPKTGRSPGPSKAMMLAVRPYDWLAESTPLKRPLYTYANWWRMKILGSGMTMPAPLPPPSPVPPAKAP